MGSFKEQQAVCGFNVAGIEAMRLAVLKSKDSAFIQSMKASCCCPDCTKESPALHPCPPGSWYADDNPYREA